MVVQTIPLTWPRPIQQSQILWQKWRGQEEVLSPKSPKIEPQHEQSQGMEQIELCIHRNCVNYTASKSGQGGAVYFDGFQPFTLAGPEQKCPAKKWKIKNKKTNEHTLTKIKDKKNLGSWRVSSMVFLWSSDPNKEQGLPATALWLSWPHSWPASPTARTSAAAPGHVAATGGLDPGLWYRNVSFVHVEYRWKPFEEYLASLPLYLGLTWFIWSLASDLVQFSLNKLTHSSPALDTGHFDRGDFSR